MRQAMTTVTPVADIQDCSMHTMSITLPHDGGQSPPGNKP